MNTRILIPSSMLLLSLSLITQSYSKDLFTIYDLTFSGELTSYHAEDINRDGLKDLLLFVTRAAGPYHRQRWLSVYFQDQQGFAQQPHQTFRVPDDVILFDIGNVNEDPQREFVYFGPGGIYYFLSHENGFELTPRKLFETESLFMLPNTRTLRYWNFVSDLNGDGVDEILIPQISKTEIYSRDSANGHWRKTSVGFGAESVVFAHYDERYSVGNRAESRYATPYITSEDFNADGRTDLIGVYRDSLVVFCQDENGFFSERCHPAIPLSFGEVWRGQKIQRTRFGDKSVRSFLKRVQDLNGDGILDVLVIRVSTKESIMSPSYEIRVHYGKMRPSTGGDRLHFSQTPDQVIKPGGIQLIFDILDLNHDGRQDLVTPIVKVGLRNIIRMLLTRSVQIEGEVYLMGENGLYPEKPDRVVKMVVNFTFRGGTTSPVYEISDFNGDGLVDVMTSIEEKRLIFFWGDDKNGFESSAGAKFNIRLPQDGELVNGEDLNSDGKTDLIITYNEDNSKYPNLVNKVRILLSN